MATWSSFEKDRLLAENWRKFVKDNPEDKSSQTVFGINSEDNPESLKSFLKKNQAAIGLTPEQVDQLVALMLAQTKEDDVVLEAIGGPQRDARTFSSDTTTKLNTLIDSFDLGAANKKKLEKVLNRWAKLNTVSFEQGAASAPAPTPAEPPPTEEPKQTSRGIDYEPYGATDATPEKRADNLVVKPSSTDTLALLNSENLEQYADIYNKLVKDSGKKIRSINNDLIDYVNLLKSKGKETDDIISLLRRIGLSSFNNLKILKKFVELATSIQRPPTDEEEAETDRVKPVSSTKPAEPEVNQEPAPEPQATEEPLKIITKILGNKGVNEEKVNAFIDDLREMGVIKEISSEKLRKSLKMNNAEWQQFSQKHREVIKAIGELRGRRNTLLRNQFKDALSGVIARNRFPRSPRSPRKKKPTPMAISKTEPTPAAATPAEPEAASPEPETTPDPEEEKQLDISQIEKNVLEAWRDYYNKDLKKPGSSYAAATMKNVMKRVDGVTDAGDTEYGTIVRFADVRNSKDEPYNAFIVPKRRKENISYIKKYYDIINEYETEEKVRVEDIEKLAKYIIFNTPAGPNRENLVEKGELKIVGSENSEAPQPPPKRKKKTAPPIKNAKDPEAYEHGKKGKSMNPSGKLIDRTVYNIEKAIEGLLKVKVGSDDEKLRDKIDSYISGLDEYEPPTKLEESLMLRWKTIAGIK